MADSEEQTCPYCGQEGLKNLQIHWDRSSTCPGPPDDEEGEQTESSQDQDENDHQQNEHESNGGESKTMEELKDLFPEKQGTIFGREMTEEEAKIEQVRMVISTLHTTITAQARRKAEQNAKKLEVLDHLDKFDDEEINRIKAQATLSALADILNSYRSIEEMDSYVMALLEHLVRLVGAETVCRDEIGELTSHHLDDFMKDMAEQMTRR